MLNSLISNFKFDVVTNIELRIMKIELRKKGKFHLSWKYNFDEFLILTINEKIRNNADKKNAVGSNKIPRSKKILPFFVSFTYFFKRFA